MVKDVNGLVSGQVHGVSRTRPDLIYRCGLRHFNVDDSF